MCINPLRLVASNAVKKNKNELKSQTNKENGVYMYESCLAFTYVPTCTSQVAFACPTGPCWSRRWWCADWSVLWFPADPLPARSRSSSYKKTMEHYSQRTTTANHVNTPAWPPPYLFCGKRAQQRGVANTRLGVGGREREGCFRRRDWRIETLSFSLYLPQTHEPHLNWSV